MKKKILHIIQGGRGGTLEYLKLLIPRLDENKYKNTVICHGEIYDELSRIGIDTVKIEMVRNPSIIKDLRALININKYISINKPDLIYVHSSKAGVLGRVIAKINHISCIYNPHGWAFNMNTSKYKRKMYILFEKIAEKWGNKIVTISQSEYNDAVKNKICDINKIVVINNGIDLKKYHNINLNLNIKNTLNIETNKKVIGLCSRLTKVKNPMMFIKVADILLNKYNKDYIFCIVGDGELKNVMESEATKLSIRDSFIFTGWKCNTNEYISIFDIGVLTSEKEGFGLTLVEYMAAGKPVVASNVGGIPYVIRNNIDGFLCDVNNPEEFALKIMKLIDEPKLYRTMSENSFERSKNFDISNVVRAHEKLFDELVD